MKTIGVFEAKTNLSKILAEVADHEQFIIQNRGKNVAILQPYEDVEKESISKSRDILLKAFSDIRAEQPDSDEEISVKDMVNEGRKW
ncbi:MAG: type II toxin-antitoxin system Phd/YefM family antitoxin [Planctomycetota bacterium]|jgi:prevent-host-death family protein